MKISAFHLMPHRELPANFERRYPSVWVTPPWWELADARRVGQYYNWTLDELLHAARAGFDGVCTNEHHQNAYGFMPSPNLMGSVLAKHDQRPRRGHRADGHDAAHDLAAHPRRRGVRHARLHQRRPARRRPAARQPDGRQPRLRHHAHGAPRALPRGVRRSCSRHGRRRRSSRGTGSTSSSARSTSGRGRCRSRTRRCGCRARAASAPSTSPSSTTSATASSATRARAPRARMMDGYWEVVERKGRERNPYRAGFLQLVAVSETDAQAEAEYARHVEYFYHKCLHVPAQWFAPPGNQDYRSLLAANRNPVRRAENPKDLRYRDFVEKGYVHRRQPRHGARSADRRGRQGPARRQPDAAGADRLDAPRADAQEHRPARPRGPAVAPRDLGRRGLGEPLVARAPAQGAVPQRGSTPRRDRTAASTRTAPVWQGRVPFRVHVKGDGPPRGLLPRAVGPARGARSSTPWPAASPCTRRSIRARRRASRTPCSTSTRCGTWSLCYDELLDQLRAAGGRAGRPLLRRPWWRARSRPCGRREPAGSCSSIRSGSGATTRR